MSFIWDLPKIMSVYKSKSGETEISRMNLFHAIAKIQLPQGDPFEIDEHMQQLFQRWGCNIIQLEDFKKFETLIGIKLQVWKVQYISEQLEAENIVNALSDNYIDVIVPWNEDFRYILADDINVCLDKNYFKGFSCSKDNCSYACARRANITAHEDSHDTKRMFYRCKRYCQERPDLLDDVLGKGYNCTNVVMFDIESLMEPTKGLQVHVPVMIACKNNFVGGESNSIFCRYDMSGEGIKVLVNEFLDKMISWARIHQQKMPKKAHRFLATAKKVVSDKHSAPWKKHWYKERAKLLQQMMELKIMGFNSMKYDTLALSNYIIDISLERYGDESVKCIKKGLGIFNLQIDTGEVQLAFRDVLSYIPKQSLDKFAVSMGVDSSKLAWPYESYRIVIKNKNINPICLINFMTIFITI